MKNNVFRAFSVRSFLYLWLGEIFTQIAVNLFNFYLILVIYSLTKSNTAVGGVVLSYTVPAIFFGIIAGVYVDRWNKKKVLYIANLIRVALLLTLMFMHTNIIMIYLISLMVAVTTQFFIPAESPLIPLIVKDKLLFSANALFGMGILVSILIAYILSGPILIAFGSFYTLLVLIILLLLGAFFIRLIEIPEKMEEKERGKVLTQSAFKREIKEAMSVVIRTKEIYSSLLLLVLSQVFVLVLAAITPGYAADVLKMDVAQFPIFFIAPAAVGTIIGAIILGNFFHEVKKHILVTSGIFLAGISLIIMPFASRIASREFVQTLNNFLPQTVAVNNLHILIFLALLIGIANALIFVPSNTLLQEKTAEALRGKVYGVMNTLVGAFSFFPILIVGSLADHIGIVKVIIGIGISLLILAITRIAIK